MQLPKIQLPEEVTLSQLLFSVGTFFLISLFILFIYLWFSFIPTYQSSHPRSSSQPSTEIDPYQNSSVRPTPSPQPEPVRLLFGGDMMYDRNIRAKAQKSGYEFILATLAPLFFQYDAVIANLEGPVTDSKTVSLGSEVGSHNNFLFTFDPAVATALYNQNLRIVNLGNNHICNFGKKGVEQTYQYLRQNNIEFFGYTCVTPTPETPRYLIKKIKNLSIGFVNYNQFLPNGEQYALEDIQTVRPQVDIVIVVTHWGNEYQEIAAQPQRQLAYQFIDTGADLVMGGHPHVIQDSEIYKGKKIYYSLGNFVFDQYFQKEVKEGLLVEVTIDETKEMKFNEYTVNLLNTGQTILYD